MIILGIDPGSRVTGYGVVDASSGDEEPIAFGTIRLDTTDSHPDRLKEIYDALTGVISAHSPDALAIEMPVYGKNPQSMLKLGRAQASAMLAALNQEMSVAQYTPKEVKKSVTGNGNASKKQVQYMVRTILSIQKNAKGFTHDSADALAVALCHSNRGAHGETQSYTGWDSFVAANPDRISE
jgi:crossover junction endodeoxyribonuclease RuvC